jgi:hypothetical protein
MTRSHQDSNSRHAHTHTHTIDNNDIRPHTVQEHNEHTSTEFNLVTPQVPPEDGRNYGPKHVGAIFKVFLSVLSINMNLVF